LSGGLSDTKKYSGTNKKIVSLSSSPSEPGLRLSRGKLIASPVREKKHGRAVINIENTDEGKDYRQLI